jgi:hypothetical protein
MQRHRRLVEGTGDRLIGLLVVLRRQFRLRPLPQRARRIDLARLALLRHHEDRELDVVGIGADDALDLIGFEIFCRVLLQMQHDLGTADDTFRRLFIGGRDLKAAAAGGGPDPDLVRSGPPAGDNDALGHHESRIEADAELADQIGAILGFGEARDKGLCAGARDGAEIVDQFLAVHADTAVDHGERVRLLVGHDPDFRRGPIGDQIGPGDRLITQLVAGVGRVGDQLAQEDVGFRIDRMHHQVQQLGNFGLERLGFGGSGGRRHAGSVEMKVSGKH